MKQLLLIFALLPVISFAQNGGQSNQNSYGRLMYRSYNNGYYYVEQTNKQSCKVDTKFNWLGKDTVIEIEGNTTAIVRLPGKPVNGLKIKSKPLKRCSGGGGDLGWLEIEAPCALPLKITYFDQELLSDNDVQIKLTVEDVDPGDSFDLKVSFDGVNFDVIGTIQPTGDGHYLFNVIRKYKADKSVYFTYKYIFFK